MVSQPPKKFWYAYFTPYINWKTLHNEFTEQTDNYSCNSYLLSTTYDEDSTEDEAFTQNVSHKAVPKGP